LNPDSTTPCVLFPSLFGKTLVARFDQSHASSDGGAILLGAADQRLGLTEQLSACLDDRRDPARITHEIVELLRQRVFALSCGYPDGNDAARLAHDPIHKMLVGRDPVRGEDLASQPTLSRFENAVSRRDLYRLAKTLTDRVIERHRLRLRGRRARRITIDLDPTADPTYGAQQLSLFNGFYDTWCYLPVLGWLTFNDEPEQYLCAAVLRPGNAPDKRGALGILSRLIGRLREAFPKTVILVRLDAGFACPEILDFLDRAPRLLYTVSMAKNKRLLRASEELMQAARTLAHESGLTERLYGECRYAARTWPKERRVIIKAEVVHHPGRSPKDNPRFVITNLKSTPRFVYARIYCERGDVENRIKELQYGLHIDRTSCPSFLANQFRVLMTAAAYVLMQEIRLHARRTSYARAQVSTLREHLFKLGVRVVCSARRIVLHLPASFPYVDVWRRIACSLGAKAG
jgi:hypothetical protein